MVKKEMNQDIKVFHVVISFALLMGALWYFTIKVDLIPATLGGIGYIDDLIILLLAVFFSWRLIQRAKSRYKDGKEQGIWKKGKVFQAFLKPRTWLAIIIIAGALFYFQWSWNLIPDYMVGIGYLDDIGVAIGAAILLIKLYSSKKGGKQ